MGICRKQSHFLRTRIAPQTAIPLKKAHHPPLLVREWIGAWTRALVTAHTMYTGTACKEELLHWKKCLFGLNSSSSIIISLPESQYFMEEQALQILNTLSKFTARLTIEEKLSMVIIYLN